MQPGRSNPSAQVNTAAARRTAYLDIMRRRIRPGSGSSLELLQSRGSFPMPDLNPLLPGVRYVVVGGTATSLYMPMRTTKDVDILVSELQAPATEQALRRAGASLIGPLSIAGSLGLRGTSWRLRDGSELDVLVSGQAWVTEALAHPNLDAAGLPIVVLPYLVLLKLDASRGMDIGDLSRMLGGANDAALGEVRTVVRKYLPDAPEDLESLIELGRLEFQSTATTLPQGNGAGEQLSQESSGQIRVREHMRGGRLVREHWRHQPIR